MEFNLFLQGKYLIKIKKKEYNNVHGPSRSSRPEMSYEKVFVKFLQNSQEVSNSETLANKDPGLQPATLLKTGSSGECSEIFKNSFFIKQL